MSEQKIAETQVIITEKDDALNITVNNLVDSEFSVAVSKVIARTIAKKIRQAANLEETAIQENHE